MSICCSNYATILSITWFESPLLPRFGTRASSQSMKTMQGLQALARQKTARTFFQLQPTYMLSSYGPFTLMKFILHYLATHFPRRVLPVPGGPQKSSPVLGLIHQSNIQGCLMGSRTVCMIYYLAVYSPPTSSQLTSMRFQTCYCFTISPIFFIIFYFGSVFIYFHLFYKKLYNFIHPNLSQY